MGFLAGIPEDILRMLLEQFGQALVKDGLDEIQEKFGDEVIRDGLPLLYIMFDLIVEDAAQRTETELDDVAVSEVKEGMEIKAGELGVTLPNLDED